MSPIIEHVVYVTSRFDFYFRHFQYLLLILLNIFHYHAIKTTKNCKTNGEYRQLAHWRRSASGSLERKADKQVNHLKDGNSDKAVIST